MEKPPRKTIETQADCACGATSISLSGPVLAMFQCACIDCQKTTGTGHSNAVLMPARAVTITGETRGYERPAESGATFVRRFCPVCATTLTGQSSRAPDVTIVPAGLLAGQNDWFAPSQLIFARSHQHWDLVPDSLPRHDAYRA